jgi:hypothetical protein
MTVVKQLSCLKYFIGKQLKKKEWNQRTEFSTRNTQYCLKFVTLVTTNLSLTKFCTQTEKYSYTMQQTLESYTFIFLCTFAHFTHKLQEADSMYSTANFKILYKCNTILTREAISLFVILNGIQHIADVSNTTT